MADAHDFRTWLYKCVHFLAIMIQMGYFVKDTLKSYWLIAEQFFTSFYTNTINVMGLFTCWDSYILVTIWTNQTRMTMTVTDFRKWEISSLYQWHLCQILQSIGTFSYGCALHKESYLKQYIPKKHKCSGLKFYKLCNMTGHIYDMSVYLGKDRQSITMTVTSLTRTKLYMDNFFSSPENLMTCEQEISTIVGLSDRITRRRRLKLKWWCTF